MKPCTNLRPQIALLVGGELTPAERPSVEAHLETCIECRSLAAALRDDRETLAALSDEETPVETLDRNRARVMAAIAAGRGAGHPPGRSAGRRRLLLLAATLAVLALGTGLWLTARRLTEAPDRIAGGPVPSEKLPAEPRISSPPPPPPERDETATEASEEPKTTTEGTRFGPVDPTRPAEPGGDASSTTPPRPDRLATAGELRDPGRTARSEHPATPAEKSSITIRIVSDDPDVVYYWLGDEPKEVSDDEAV